MSLALSDQLWICAFHEQNLFVDSISFDFRFLYLSTWRPISDKRANASHLELEPEAFTVESPQISDPRARSAMQHQPVGSQFQVGHPAPMQPPQPQVSGAAGFQQYLDRNALSLTSSRRRIDATDLWLFP